MENKEENDDVKRRIQLEIRLKIAKVCLIGIAGGLALFIIKRIIGLFAN